VVVNPDAALRRIALQEGWEIIALDRLGRRLKVLAALGVGTALASAGRLLVERAGAPRTGERLTVGPRRGSGRQGSRPRRRVGGGVGGRGRG
jgi:hypothetical protein